MSTIVWGRIELLGHVTVYGSIQPSAELPGLLDVRTIYLPARASEPDPAGVVTRWSEVREQWFLVGPAAVYRVSPMDMPSTLLAAEDAQPFRYDIPDHDDMPF